MGTALVKISYDWECDGCGAINRVGFSLVPGDKVQCGQCGTKEKVKTVRENVRPSVMRFVGQTVEPVI